jgi:hypothetical protein
VIRDHLDGRYLPKVGTPMAYPPKAVGTRSEKRSATGKNLNQQVAGFFLILKHLRRFYSTKMTRAIDRLNTVC